MAAILFICSGNVCRSPMAEHLLRQRLGSQAPWRVSSAGLLAVGGAPATPEAVTVMAEEGVDLGGHRSRQVDAALLGQSAVVLAMTRAHLAGLAVLAPACEERTFLLRAFDDTARDREIEDPIGGTLAQYRRCRDAIARCLPGLQEFLESLA